jgi:acetylornithine deacetylase/succinyl-diaminopimelate desuccinylase-like protein
MIKKYYDLLSEFIAIKSVSPDKSFSEDMKKCAGWISDLFHQHGVDAQVVHGFGNPIVLAKHDTATSIAGQG